jgi:hypothetical protein
MLIEADLGPRIAALPSRIRVAVAVVCVERVLPLFEVMSDRGVETARHALRLAWSWAEGEAIDPRARRSAIDALEEALPKEGDDRGAAVRTLERVGLALVHVLEATAAEDGVAMGGEKVDEYCARAASAAVMKAQAAVQGFERFEDGDGWAFEEQSFQRAILILAESGDVASIKKGAKAQRSPSFLDWLEEEWGWERDESADEGEGTP